MVSAALVHPAKHRRIQARMPQRAEHGVFLRPLGNGGARSIIHTATAQDFIEALLHDLQQPDWANRLAAMRRRRLGRRDGVLELNQPVHRRFQIVLFELCCDQPGQPRLDPAKLRGCGFVVRRVSSASTAHREGWFKRRGAIDGWKRLTAPQVDPQLGVAMMHPANANIRAAIAQRIVAEVPPAKEVVHALYPAPPEVCAALRRTVLFGVIPVVSAETSDAAPAPIDYRSLPADELNALAEHLSSYLAARPQISMPRAGQQLSARWNILDSATKASDPQLAAFGTFLFQLMQELDAFGDGAGAQSLMNQLGSVALPMRLNQRGEVLETMSAADFVRRAAAILIGRESNSAGLTMPHHWPRISEQQGAALFAAALDCLSDRYGKVAPAEGKFARTSARYTVRGFARIATDHGCPDRLVWSIESEMFRILPWWDGDGPGTTIALPSMADLRGVKPSVAFAMPPGIANLLRGDMKKLAEGEGSTDGPDIAWLCSFSIPFITICAFIVLHIFLALLDIIFRWMLFIKVCIPIPKASPPASGGG